MTAATDSDRLLVESIRRGNSDAWGELIARYEGRLLAFVESRLGRRGSAEDIVQEAFIGFLSSLPNYDGRRPLESYLFSICAYKLTDHLRREGRRPALPLSVGSNSSGEWEVESPARGASSIARSGERRKLEETAIVEALRQQVARWKERGDWTKLRCIELLIVRGWANKDAAEQLGISEQQVANFKFDFLARMRTLVQKQGVPQDVFPEVYDDWLTIGVRRVRWEMAKVRPFTPHELEAFLEEALAPEEMARIEMALRSQPKLARTLVEITARRDSGVHTLGEIWRRNRISCPTREHLGSYLLSALSGEQAEYVAFHVEAIGCRFCLANLGDLQRQQEEAADTSTRRRTKYFQSSAGFLRSRSER